MTAILEVRDLVKKCGDFTAVKGVSLDIQENDIFSLLGPNGAGKTTTISVLSTLYQPTSGDAAIAGHSVTHNPMAVRKLIGVVPQELALYDDLTARENLAFWGQMYNLGGKALKDRIGEVLEQIGLTDKSNQRIKTFSGGMKRRVNIGVGRSADRGRASSRWSECSAGDRQDHGSQRRRRPVRSARLHGIRHGADVPDVHDGPGQPQLPGGAQRGHAITPAGLPDHARADPGR
jgi:hypothetical protein